MLLPVGRLSLGTKNDEASHASGLALSASFGAILIAAVLYGIPNFTVHATGQPPAVLDKLKLTQEILLTERRR